MNTITLRFFVAIAVLFGPAGLAAADYITGAGWAVPPAVARNAPSLGNTPGPGAVQLVSFTASGIDFSGDAGYTLGGFLNYKDRASNVSYFTGASANTSLDYTEWEFTGSALFTHGQVFSVLHDDGVNMYINGASVLLAGGQTSPSTSTSVYNGSTGTFNFDFIYLECCGAPAEFKSNLVPSSPESLIPEPPAGLLLTGGFFVCAMVWIRRATLGSAFRSRHSADSRQCVR